MFGRKIAGALVLALVLLCAGAGAFAIDGATFAQGTQHTLSNTGSDLTYYPIAFTLSNATGDNAGSTIYTDGLTQPDWRDLRFTNGTNVVLPHWIESTATATAFVWVNVSSVPGGDSVIRVYYDSDDAPASGNGSATFPLFEDFSASLTAGKWAAIGNGGSVSGGYYTTTGGTGVFNGISSVQTFDTGYAVRGLDKLDDGVSSAYSNFGFFTDTSHLAYFYGNYGGSNDQTWTYAANSERQAAAFNNADYAVYEVQRNATTSVIFRVNDSATNTHTTQVTTGSISATIRSSGSSASQSTDWILVRPFVATEPAHGAYAEMAEPPTAAFSADVTSGEPPLTVQFTDTSTNTPTSWAWDFDNDGDTDSTDQNPTYEYAAEGTYTVKLTVTNSAGSDDEIKTDYIAVETAYVVPVAAFSANVTEGYTPLVVAFTDESTGPPTEWAWEFAGPNEFYDLWITQNATLTFTDPGVYSVSLLATNLDGNDYENKTGYITVLALPAAPVASFVADVVSGHAPLAVQFTDTSAGPPTSWAWDFDGDAVADSTDQNPTHEYAANGTYTVTLQVSNAGGTDLETKAGYVYVGELTARLLRAGFSYSTPIGTAPFSVSFTDTSASNGTYTRVWDFGDGSTSTEPAPVHEYATAGKYDVELVVSSDYTQDRSAARKAVMAYPAAAVSPLPTTTFGAHMTEIMESNWNVSVIGPIIPRAYTDALTPLAGDTGVGNMIFWGIIWVGVFMILFLRQGTPWLAALVGLVAGPGILTFLPPEWAHVGYICLAVTIGCSFFVIALGRFRST